MSNPIPTIPLQYAHIGTPIRRDKTLRVLALLAWLTCLLGFVLIVSVHVETVIGTGPLLFMIGLGMFIVALRARRTRYLILGATHCAFCLLFFMLVQRFD